jgi:ABC-2 type transport system permease protein
MQLVLFGYAINMDPKALPAAVVAADSSTFSRSLVRSIENTGYFKIVALPATVDEADRLLVLGKVQFVLQIPEDFSRKVQRGERATVLLEADASDPAATSNALTALQQVNLTGLDHDLTGALAARRTGPPAFEIRVHRRYNPEGITQYNIVPGLMGVVLTMTMVMMTSIAMTRERERGTMENLLATPVRPLEVMLGKIVPYVVVGYVQVVVILTAAKFLFEVPIVGSLLLLSSVLVLFIGTNLAIGFTFSTLAKSQMQAMQMTMFFFLPSMLLSGFMFPFRGMPEWAQVIGEAFPLTHFLRIVRGIMLKGSDAAEIAPNVWPLALILLVVSALALKRYQRTLD